MDKYKQNYKQNYTQKIYQDPEICAFGQAIFYSMF